MFCRFNSSFRCLAVLLLIAVTQLLTGATRAQTKETNSFKLKITASAQAKLNAPVDFCVQVFPQKGYKINPEYPHRLQITPPAAVATPKELQLNVKQAAKMEKGELQFKSSFKISKAGKQEFKGTIAFSVCTESFCEMKKEAVQWITQVK